MEKDHLMRANDSFALFIEQLRLSYEDAVESSGSQFAEIVLFGMVEDAAKMERRMARIVDAAMLDEISAAERKSK